MAYMFFGWEEVEELFDVYVHLYFIASFFFLETLSPPLDTVEANYTVSVILYVAERHRYRTRLSLVFAEHQYILLLFRFFIKETWFVSENFSLVS